MLARRALSIAFWSAAREEETSFFCSSESRQPQVLAYTSLPRIGSQPSGFVPDHSYLCLLSLLEESLLAGLLLGLLTNEVLGLGDLVDLAALDSGKVDLLGGGDDVSGVDPSEGDTVDLEGAGNEEDTLVEGLQENDALATETASEQDQDGTGLEGGARGPGADGLADLCGN